MTEKIQVKEVLAVELVVGVVQVIDAEGIDIQFGQQTEANNKITSFSFYAPRCLTGSNFCRPELKLKSEFVIRF